MSRLSRWIRSFSEQRVRRSRIEASRRLELFETTTGRWWLPALDSDPVISTIRRGDIFDADVVAEAELHIRPGSTVLDLGSNFGQMAVLFSRMTGPTGVVHAFEADPFICQALRKNVEANDAKNVIVHEAAVWHMDGRSLFYPEQDLVRFGALGSYGIDPNATKGRTVPSITIDSLNLPANISFMKIDIQGSDLYAMMGAERTISQNRMPILFEFESLLQDDFGTTFADYEALIEKMRYQISKKIGEYDYLITPISV